MRRNSSRTRKAGYHSDPNAISLGMREVVVDWQLPARRQKQGRRDPSAARSGDRSCRIWPVPPYIRQEDGSWPDGFYGNEHQMGTTRMHRDPASGVVDENCRVHTVANLYIAGSSVFPTGGANNPTLTIVALALRLADHVKQQLA